MARFTIAFISFIALVTSVSTSALTFNADPIMLAKAETRAWQDYYEQEQDKVYADLVTMLILQYNLIHSEAVVVANDYSVAVAIFAKLPQDSSSTTYEKQVLPFLLGSYASLNEYCKLENYKDAAKYELAWWMQRRNAKTSDPATVGHTMAKMFAAIYGEEEENKQAYERAGYLRAIAAQYRDLSHDNWQGNQAEDWDTIEQMLFHAYRSMTGL